MRLKQLAQGDNVYISADIEIKGHKCCCTLHGTILELKEDSALVEYQLQPECNAKKYQDWWNIDKLLSKHHLSTIDEEHYENAEKITEEKYGNNPIFFNDSYYKDILEFKEYMEDEELPNYVWACNVEDFKPNLDYRGYTAETLDEESEEGFSNQEWLNSYYQKLDEIQNEITEEIKKQKSVLWNVNYRKAVILKKSTP